MWRDVFVKVAAPLQFGQHQGSLFALQQPGVDALRLHAHRMQHALDAGTPVGAIDRNDAEAESLGFRFAGKEAIDDIGHHGLHGRRVIDASVAAWR